MKLKRTIFLMTLFAACQAIAQQATNAPSKFVTVTVEKPKFHWLAPAEAKKAKENLRPVEGLDPRAWTTAVGWHPGESAFATGETHEGGWCLFWIDIERVPVAR
ncbi:MAG: hypothetical protein WBW41_06845 [Verrucomicrobiia bacterium]